jgi:hypothetical protein
MSDSLKDSQEWRRAVNNDIAVNLPRVTLSRMNLKGKRSDLWRHSYLAYLLEYKGINITLTAHVLGVTIRQWHGLAKNPSRLQYGQMVKLANLLNISLFELVALVDMMTDKDAAKYTAEYYYNEMLRSKTLTVYRELKRMQVLNDISPRDLYNIVERYEEEKGVKVGKQ